MAGGGSTTRRGGRQKGTPNKATEAKRQSMQAGQRALEALMSGNATDIAEIRRAIELNEHSNPVDQAEGTMTEADALQQVALRENKYYATALDYLQDTYRDNRLPRGLRQDAAKAAIRYETPALSNIAVQQAPDHDAEIRAADNRKSITSVVESVLERHGISTQHKVTDVVDVSEVSDSDAVVDIESEIKRAMQEANARSKTQDESRT